MNKEDRAAIAKQTIEEESYREALRIMVKLNLITEFKALQMLKDKFKNNGTQNSIK